MTHRQALALARAMVRQLGPGDWRPEVTLVNRTPPRTFEIKAVSRCRRYSVTSLRGLYVAHALGYVESGRTAPEAAQAVWTALSRRLEELREAVMDPPSMSDAS